MAFSLGGPVSLPRMGGGAQRPRVVQIPGEILYWGNVSVSPRCISRLSSPGGVAALRIQLHSALLRSVNQARLGILAGRRRICGAQLRVHRIACQESLDSRVPEAPLCCTLRTKRGLAFWHGCPISLPRMGEVRHGPELSQFQMKFCIGELFLEAQAGSPDFLAQAEWPRLGIRSTPFCCAL